MSVESVKKPMAAIAPFGLRMQPHLKEKIEAAATASQRSMNAEIAYRLDTFDDLADEVQRLREQAYQNEIIIKRLTGMAQAKPREAPDMSQMMEVVGKQQAMIEQLMESLREQGKLIDRLARPLDSEAK